MQDGCPYVSVLNFRAKIFDINFRMIEEPNGSFKEICIDSAKWANMHTKADRWQSNNIIYNTILHV